MIRGGRKCSSCCTNVVVIVRIAYGHTCIFIQVAAHTHNGIHTEIFAKCLVKADGTLYGSVVTFVTVYGTSRLIHLVKVYIRRNVDVALWIFVIIAEQELGGQHIFNNIYINSEVHVISIVLGLVLYIFHSHGVRNNLEKRIVAIFITYRHVGQVGHGSSQSTGSLFATTVGSATHRTVLIDVTVNIESRSQLQEAGKLCGNIGAQSETFHFRIRDRPNLLNVVAGEVVVQCFCSSLYCDIVSGYTAVFQYKVTPIRGFRWSNIAVWENIRKTVVIGSRAVSSHVMVVHILFTTESVHIFHIGRSIEHIQVWIVLYQRYVTVVSHFHFTFFTLFRCN